MEDVAGVELTTYDTASIWSLRATTWKMRWIFHLVQVLQYAKSAAAQSDKEEEEPDVGGTNKKHKFEKRESKARRPWQGAQIVVRLHIGKSLPLAYPRLLDS